MSRYCSVVNLHYTRFFCLRSIALQLFCFPRFTLVAVYFLVISVCFLFSHSVFFFYFTCPQQAAPDAIADLKKELVLLRQKHDAGTVDSALGVLRQLLARPAAIFDPHASLAALEQLVDLAREKGDERANRFGIVLRQTRTLLYNPSFQHLLLKLIGSKEEVEVAKEIQKALKQSPPTYLPGNSVNSGGPSRPFPRARQAQVCFSCGRRGHYARSCWAKRGPYYSVNRK